MLILTRRIGESVYIGDEVRLTVLGVRGTQVRLGINAPKDIPVHREEIYYKIKHEQAGGARGNEQPSQFPPGAQGNDYAAGDAGNMRDPRDESFDDEPSPEEPDPNNA